jgi:hypothetical protein
MAFPNLFPYGHNGKDDLRFGKVTLSKYIHNRMRNSDRRYMNALYLFYLANHQDMKTIDSALSFSAKKSKNFNQEGFFEKVLNNETNFEANVSTLLPQLRSHDSYWRQRNLEVKNMNK